MIRKFKRKYENKRQMQKIRRLILPTKVETVEILDTNWEYSYEASLLLSIMLN